MLMVTEYMGKGSIYKILRPQKAEDVPSIRIRFNMAKQCAQVKKISFAMKQREMRKRKQKFIIEFYCYHYFN